MTYRVILIKSDEGFAVACPAISGCWSQGDTEGEAVESISDAISEMLDVGCVPEKDGGAAAEAELLREAAADRLNVMVREVQLPVPV